MSPSALRPALNGVSGILVTSALGGKGFRIVIFPGGVVRFIGAQMQNYYATLLEHGTAAPMRDAMLDFDGLNGVIGTPELIERGRRYWRYGE